MGALQLPSGAEYWRRVEPESPIGECELLSELNRVTIEAADVGLQEPRLGRDTYAYVMVVTQACDLEFDGVARRQIEAAGPAPLRGQERIDWDAANRSARGKLLEGILVCVADEVEVVHDASGLRTKQWQFVESNQRERYHSLRPGTPEVDHEGKGFPALVLDFKRYFTVPPEELGGRVALTGDAPGRARRRAVLVSPFLEDVASRFFRFQARVALPDEQRP